MLYLYFYGYIKKIKAIFFLCILDKKKLYLCFIGRRNCTMKKLSIISNKLENHNKNIYKYFSLILGVFKIIFFKKKRKYYYISHFK